MCSTGAKTDKNEDDGTEVFIVVTKPHSCAPSPVTTMAVRIRSKIRQEATNSQNSPRTIVNKCLTGCWFHFNQSIWRSIQSKGLALRYGLQAEYATALKKFSALAFCDVELDAGEQVPLYSRIEYRQANERLLNLIQDYNNIDDNDYLTQCVNYVHFD
uniref:Uncharacterized protein n=1 Tax=Meloidogyne javanica TaxID=6303 RepID=A0A915MIY8_MELJA